MPGEVVFLEKQEAVHDERETIGGFVSFFVSIFYPVLISGYIQGAMKLLIKRMVSTNTNEE
jgi:hypothetical protein